MADGSHPEEIVVAGAADEATNLSPAYAWYMHGMYADKATHLTATNPNPALPNIATTHYWPVCTTHSSLRTRYYFPVTYYLPVTTCYLLLTSYHLLLTTYHLLQAVNGVYVLSGLDDDRSGGKPRP
eukprot:scaffold84185_cov45-Phaeocystis_antarctica.AAC.1